jgi:hypothetical protein
LPTMQPPCHRVRAMLRLTWRKQAYLKDQSAPVALH